MSLPGSFPQELSFSGLCWSHDNKFFQLPSHELYTPCLLYVTLVCTIMKVLLFKSFLILGALFTVFAVWGSL